MGMPKTVRLPLRLKGGVPVKFTPNVGQSPGQIFGLLMVKATAGAGVTATVMFAVAVQPMPSLAVTE